LAPAISLQGAVESFGKMSNISGKSKEVRDEKEKMKEK
jgi:hypothetical protein